MVYEIQIQDQILIFSKQKMKSDFVPCALPLSPLSVYLYSFMEINI